MKILVIGGVGYIGDVAVCYSDVSKAERELDWRAEYGLDGMYSSSWRWQQNSMENKN